MKHFSFPENFRNSLDPCSIGPLTCGGGVRPEDDEDDDDLYDENETPRETLFSVAHRKGGGRPNMTKLAGRNHNYDPYADLKQRIADFQLRGWLSQKEYNKYMSMLHTNPTQRGNQERMNEYIQKEVVQELDRLEAKMNLSKQLRKNILAPRTNKRKNQNNTSGLFDEDSDQVTDAASPKNSGPSIRDAYDLKEQIGKEQIEDLFVEMCFFARLGFLQPPCCLKCTYSESQKGKAAESNCLCWVVWRKDANYVLHPNTMENTIFLRCHAAQALLQGEMVESHKWDERAKVLLFPKKDDCADQS